MVIKHIPKHLFSYKCQIIDSENHKMRNDFYQDYQMLFNTLITFHLAQN